MKSLTAKNDMQKNEIVSLTLIFLAFCRNTKQRASECCVDVFFGTWVSLLLLMLWVSSSAVVDHHQGCRCCNGLLWLTDFTCLCLYSISIPPWPMFVDGQSLYYCDAQWNTWQVVSCNIFFYLFSNLYRISLSLFYLHLISVAVISALKVLFQSIMHSKLTL